MTHYVHTGTVRNRAAEDSSNSICWCSDKLISMLSDQQNCSYAKSTVNSIYIHFKQHRASE